ncbi:MAG: ABC transporter ATP-binding protein [Actinobacteria bacterium]|nr:ABC transporter ATP-binding protein [Actinomycetota bacterium]
MTTSAVSVEGVSKRFRLYHERNQSLKASLVRGRRARYEELWALRDVTLEVREGTTLGLIGKNGSGKSTLLKSMARILRPDEGRISVAGRLSALLELGAGFHPELSGRENIFLNGSILGLGRKELKRKFDDIVAFAGVEPFIDTPVKDYSSGMYVRLGFSVAINVDPAVLLVDEVLAVGDESFQRKCREKFADLQAEGRTVVIVSHDLDAVRDLCHDAALLEGGRLERAGAVGEVIDHYLGRVHLDRVEEDALGARWGTGEGRIQQVEVLGAGGGASTLVRTGDPVVFRLHYHTSEPIERPVFTLGVYTVEGIHVSEPNTRNAGLVPDKVEGRGHVDLRVDRLLLVPGTYDLTASLTDHTGARPYDVRHRAFRFEVMPGTPLERHGVISLGGRWEGEALDT